VNPALSDTVGTDGDSLVFRVWAEADNSIHARLTTNNLTTVLVGRDKALAAFAAWLDAITAELD